MSNALINLVMPLAMSPAEKMVLLVLADAARDDDDPDFPRQTWLTMRTTPKGALGLVERTCLGERTVQRSLRALEAAGHIEIDQRPGRGVLYTVLPSHSGTPATAAPRHNGTSAIATASPATVAPNPLVPLKTPSKASPSSVKRARRDPRFEPPDWIPIEAWDGWIEMRKRKRAPLDTQRAFDLVISSLQALADAGHDPGAVLDQSTKNRWTDIYELKENRHDVRNPINRLSTIRGSRPDPALDMWRQAVADEHAASSSGSQADFGTRAALPSQ